MQHTPELVVEMRNVEDLALDPANSRQHSERNVEALLGSLRKFGQQKPIVVDSSGVVVAGNGTLDAARQLGWAQIAVIVTDLSGAKAAAFAIADNRTAELADWNRDVLVATLQAIEQETEGLASAAGFNQADIDLLISVIARDAGVGGDVDTDQEWQGMPEFTQPDAKGFREIIVHFNTQEDVDRFSELVGQTFTDKTKFMWFPKAEIDKVADKRWASESEEPA